LGAGAAGAGRADQRQNDRLDSSTLEANAAKKSIVRRDMGGSYMAYLQRLAEAEGIDDRDTASLLRMDRKRKKKTSNEEWNSPGDEEAESRN